VISRKAILKFTVFDVESMIGGRLIDELPHAKVAEGAKEAGELHEPAAKKNHP
jgi:hypothetical protein